MHAGKIQLKSTLIFLILTRGQALCFTCRVRPEKRWEAVSY
jgi:hypothetical protein